MNQGNIPGNAYRYVNHPMNSGGKSMIPPSLQQPQVAQLDLAAKRMDMSQQEQFRSIKSPITQYDILQNRMGMQQVQNMRMPQQLQMNAAFQQKRPHISPTQLPVSYAQQNTAQYMQQLQSQHPGVMKMPTQPFAAGQHVYPQMMPQMMQSMILQTSQPKHPMMKPSLPVIGGSNRDMEPKELPDPPTDSVKKNLEKRLSTYCQYTKVLRVTKMVCEEKVILCVDCYSLGESCTV